ncbi:hypothetical protein VTL71DRAFT_2040 [Oculimacula yallundae]|uniref:Uncharacterized protein n=1 Tax=Oculimacula yallundae TaxID=86028 RepID=A0ABR4CCY2_9HELO
MSLLIAILTCPALLATNEAIRQGQTKDRREEHRARRCNLVVSCSEASPLSVEIDHRQVALKNSRLYIKTNPADMTLHPFAGYYLPYPTPPDDAPYEGLVSTITDEAPILNWIYVERETYQVKYGVKADADPNITGPFECTRQDKRLTLDKWEGFLAVKEDDGEWGLYFDIDEDMLVGKLGEGKEVLEVELCRWEKRVRRGNPLGDMRE